MIVGALVVATLVVMIPFGAKAATVTAANGSSTMSYLSDPLSSKIKSVGDLVQTIAQIFAYIAVIIGVLALIWTGLQYVLAQGNSERIKELKSQLLWIVVGIAIVIGARIIIGIVINTLSATGTVDQNIINNAQNALNGQ